MSRFCVWLARKIKPDCPYAYSYFMEEMVKSQMDMMTYGTGTVKIEHVPIERNTK